MCQNTLQNSLAEIQILHTLSSLSLSLFSFFFDKADWCLDWQNLVFVRSNDHSTVKRHLQACMQC